MIRTGKKPSIYIMGLYFGRTSLDANCLFTSRSMANGQGEKVDEGLEL